MKEAIDAAVNLIKRLEGFRAIPYWDVNGWAVGYGTHVNDPPKHITREQAEALARKRLEELYTEIGKEGPIRLTINQWAAVLSWAYNVGIGNVRKSKLLRALKAGDMAEAAKQFDRWVYVKGKTRPGLIKRRVVERRIFEGKEAI